MTFLKAQRLPSCVGTAGGGCWTRAHRPSLGSRQAFLDSRNSPLLFLESGRAGSSRVSGSCLCLLLLQRAPLHLCDPFLILFVSCVLLGSQTLRQLSGSGDKARDGGRFALMRTPAYRLLLARP